MKTFVSQFSFVQVSPSPSLTLTLTLTMRNWTRSNRETSVFKGHQVSLIYLPMIHEMLLDFISGIFRRPCWKRNKKKEKERNTNHIKKYPKIQTRKKHKSKTQHIA